MTAGYVYILINPSMPGLIKIGCTQRDSRTRAGELQTTGVPTPFEVAFEILTAECEKVEAEMHAHLANFRVSAREFFRYPLKDAIDLLLRLHSRLRHHREIGEECDSQSKNETDGTDARSLAQGSAELTFDVKYRAEGRWFEGYQTLTWDRIFAAIAPLMFDPASERDLIAQLEEVVLQESVLHGREIFGHPITSVQVSHQALHTIKIHLRALGLIEKKRSKQGTCWELTAHGERYVTRLLAIPANV